jgi:hypothetical protein
MRHTTIDHGINRSPPPAGGMAKEIPAVGKLARTAGKIVMTCPVCLLDFERYLCHAKRVKVNYCGRACSSVGAERKSVYACIVCSKPMLLNPSDSTRVSTCSTECSSEYRTAWNLAAWQRGRSSARGVRQIGDAA